MSLPPGFDERKEGQVCKLKKSLYGLKQSPRAWFDRFSKVLKAEGYKQCLSNHTMFVKVKGGKTCVLIVYVDDIIIIGDNEEEIISVKATLGREFEVKDLRKLKYFPAMEVATSKKGIYASQQKYVLDLLIETRKLGCKPIDTPIAVKKKKRKRVPKKRSRGR